MSAVVIALPVLVLPLLAWLLRDIHVQQKRRAARRQELAAQMAALRRALVEFRVVVFDRLTPSLQKAAQAVAELGDALATNPSPAGTRESVGEMLGGGER